MTTAVLLRMLHGLLYLDLANRLGHPNLQVMVLYHQPEKQAFFQIRPGSPRSLRQQYLTDPRKLIADFYQATILTTSKFQKKKVSSTNFPEYPRTDILIENLIL